MRPHDLSRLEFDTVRELLAQHTSFSAGRARALGLMPATDPGEVERQQQLTAQALQLRTLRPSLGLGGARDISALAHRAALGAMLSPSELLEVQATAHVAGQWRAALERLERELPTLADLRHGLSDHRQVGAAISAAVDDAGLLVDSASPDLRRIRSELRVMQERVGARLREMVASPTYRELLQEPIVTQRGGRYVVPVRAECRGQFKGIVHDQSASGATLFMEPLDLVELGNRCRQLEIEQQREIERVLLALSAVVGHESEALERTVDSLAELDLLVAKARLAEAMAATRPEVVNLERKQTGEAVLRLLSARHPLLAGEVVPITVELGAGYDVVVITGPNTGGKTVALKTVGLLSLMAQAGLHVPAAPGSCLAVFEVVMADIGDEQSIEQSLSTFSSHVTQVVEMLHHCGPRSLVLLDELGAGTDPLEGAALARAIVRYLLARRAYCVATTHYPELKAFAAATPRVENASVEFDLETLSPTYRLSIGLPGRSNALAVAARLGMPGEVLEEARSFLSPEHGELEGLLADVRHQREAGEAERARAEAAAEEQERLRHRLREALDDAERQRREVWQRAREEAEAELQALRREIAALRRRVSALPARSDLEEVVAEAERLQPITVPAIARPAEPAESPGPVRVGMEVHLPELGVVGTVLALEAGEAELEVHGRRVRLPASRLTHEASRPTSRVSRPDWEMRTWEARPGTPDAGSGTRDAPLQIDLRGKRRDEAVHDLDGYLHEAYMDGLRSVRVVHGRGTGAVRQAVQELLTSHPLVEAFTFADRHEGGDGATIVRLGQ